MVSGYFFQKFVLNVQCLQFLVSAIRSAAQPALLREFVACFEDLEGNAEVINSNGVLVCAAPESSYTDCSTFARHGFTIRHDSWASLTVERAP